MFEVIFMPISDEKRDAVREFVVRQWGVEIVIGHGEVFYPHQLNGFIAFHNDEIVGLVTYLVREKACEIVTIDSLHENRGIGTHLVERVREVAVALGCNRLWLITTNDNIDALRFYQKRNFQLVAVHRNAVEQARKLKPSIPEVGFYGIPLRDEIELEMPL